MIACARSSAAGQEGGDSFGITPLTYWSTASALTTLRSAAARGDRLERAAVAAEAGDRDRPAGGRRLQHCPAVGQHLAAGAEQRHRLAEPVGVVAERGVEGLPAGAGRAAEADVGAGGFEQDAHGALLGERPQRGPLVVVGEDEGVGLAVLGVAVGAVGAEPDAVAEPAPVDDPVDAGAGRRRDDRGEARERREHGEQEGVEGLRLHRLHLCEQVRRLRVAASSLPDHAER